MAAGEIDTTEQNLETVFSNWWQTNVLIIGLSLYWNVHTSSDFSTVDSGPCFELSPFLHNATHRDLSY